MVVVGGKVVVVVGGKVVVVVWACVVFVFPAPGVVSFGGEVGGCVVAACVLLAKILIIINTCRM